MPRYKIKLPAVLTGTIEYALSIILARPALNLRNIGPETQLSMDVADAFRRHVRDGRFKGVFTKIANEGKRSILSGAILRAMGMIPGVSDFIFAWSVDGREHIAWIELKIPGEKLRDKQEFFARWCNHCKLTYAVAHSVEEVESTLRALGGLA